MGGSLLGGFVQGFTAGAGLKFGKTAREKKREDLQDKLLEARAARLLRGPKGTDPLVSRARKQALDFADEKMRNYREDRARAKEERDEYANRMSGDGDRLPPRATQNSFGSDNVNADGYPIIDQEPDSEGWGDDDASPVDELPEEESGYYSRGGAVAPRRRRRALKVRSFAGGGSVDSEQSAEDTDDYDAEDREVERLDAEDTHANGINMRDFDSAMTAATANDDDDDAGTFGATDFSSASRTTRTSAVPTGPRGRAPADRERESKASFNDVMAAEKAVDPDGTMTRNERTMATYAKLYRYYSDRGETEKATRSVQQLHQHYQHQNESYAQLAKVAAQNGDVKGTMQFVLKAHQHVADGMEMKMFQEKDGRIGVTLTDVKTGKVEKKFVASNDEILNWASKGQIPDFKSLTRRAYGEPTAPKETATDHAQANRLAKRSAENYNDRNKDEFEAYDTSLRSGRIDPTSGNVDPKTASPNHSKTLITEQKRLIDGVKGLGYAGDPQLLVEFVRDATENPGPPEYKIGKDKRGNDVAMYRGQQIKLNEDLIDRMALLTGQARKTNQKALYERALKGENETEKQRQRMVREDEEQKREIELSDGPVGSFFSYQPNVR